MSWLRRILTQAAATAGATAEEGTKTECRVVDNRVFLLGLDRLYREAMKRHERDELLCHARETASVLSVAPANVPIEGYYTEDERLTEYFRLVRALQRVPRTRESESASLVGFKRLREVTESPLFGPPSNGPFLLSTGEDALSVALQTASSEWTVENLTKRAYECAAGSSDFSLVALAALARDPVVLAALRESVVLYAAAPAFAIQREPEYVWEVDEIIEKRAARFIETFNELFNEHLPQAAPENARRFWMACRVSEIRGRCVRIGFDDRVSPTRHYHWAIDTDANYRPVVKEFWDTEIWTSTRYRAAQGAKARR